MKRIICLIAICAMTSPLFGMDDSVDQLDENPAIAWEKEILFKRLIEYNRIKCTSALATIEKRCCRDIPWKETEKRIIYLLQHRNIYEDLEFHPGLMRLKGRAVKYKLKNTNNFDIKQDLFCIDRQATAATPEAQLVHLATKICHRECQNAIDSIRLILRTLRFLPIGFEPEDSN